LTWKISHSFDDEKIENKARWFRSLTLEERMNIFCEYTDLIIAVNPAIMEKKNAQPIKGRVRVLSKT
jgi:hypothetical protein